MKKPKYPIEGEGIIIKMGNEYRFIMRVGKILYPPPGKEIIRFSEGAKNPAGLKTKLKEVAKKRARELGIRYVTNLDPEPLYP